MVNTLTQTTYPTYIAYKDSGEYWMGEIPEYWETKKLKHLFAEKKITHNHNLGCGAISFGEVITKDDDKIPESTKASYQEVLDGEFLVNPLNLNYDLKSLRIALSEISVVVSSGYIVLKDLGQINRQYYKYLLHRYDVAYMKLLGSGVRQTINFNHISNSLLAFPPLPEQTAIANFLDEKTTKIDQAIAQKEKMIALLKERKQIIIQNAVTKGLDPNAKMKDSGVEWIGKIPEHWEVKKVKHVANVVLGKMICNQNMGSMELKPYLKSKNIQWLKVDISSVDEMWFTKQEMEQYRLKKNDLVLSEGGEVGKTCIWNDELPECYIQNSAHKVTLHSESNPFFYLYLFSHIGKQGGFDSIINRVSIGHLTKDKLLNIEVVKPILKEQTAIVAHIETQSVKIDQTIALQKTQIEKLKEYKATLIDSAVTGKINVTDYGK